MTERQAEALRGLCDVVRQGQRLAAYRAARARRAAFDTVPYTLSPLAETLLSVAATETATQ